MVIHVNENSKNRSNVRVEASEYNNETIYLEIVSRLSVCDFSELYMITTASDMFKVEQQEK